MLWNHHPAPLTASAATHAADKLPPEPAIARARPERSALSATTVDLVLAHELEELIGHGTQSRSQE